MHDFFVTAGKMEFDRPVPFEIGGDPAGVRDAYEFRVLDQAVQLVDWAQIPPMSPSSE
jgi:diacylglycerol kinase family enzyme